MGPLYYIYKMTKDERREDSPNDHFIPLTDQTNRRMLFDGHKQKLFGMSSIVLVAPKMPPQTVLTSNAHGLDLHIHTVGGRHSVSFRPGCSP